MPIDFSNVNITIQQFQQIASGKFNAGEVKLKSEHSLDVINNHVRSRDENVKTISHDEVLAIKQAFVRALSQNGVGPDALNDIRRRIGLAPDPSLPVALAQRSMKPLSRQQIRSILDEHKETINNVAGNGTIRTHAEIYARHGNEALARYEQTRRATNEEFMRGRNLDSDRRVLDIQRVIAGDIHFRNDADRRLLVSAAEMLRSEILRLSNGNPPDDPLGTITYKRGNGLRITLGLGMSQKAFVDKLDDMLLQLRADRPTPQSALDAHNEYRRAKADGAGGIRHLYLAVVHRLDPAEDARRQGEFGEVNGKVAGLGEGAERLSAERRREGRVRTPFKHEVGLRGVTSQRVDRVVEKRGAAIFGRNDSRHAGDCALRRENKLQVAVLDAQRRLCARGGGARQDELDRVDRGLGVCACAKRVHGIACNRDLNDERDSSVGRERGARTEEGRAKGGVGIQLRAAGFTKRCHWFLLSVYSSGSSWD